MGRPTPPANSVLMPRFVLLAAVCVVVAALYFAQEVLVPLALATLLTFLLSPLVQRLERFGLHRIAATVVVVALTTGAIGGLGWIVFGQVMDLARELPTYRENIKGKLKWLPKAGDPGVLTEIKKTVDEIAESNSTTQPANSGPLLVRIQEPEPTPFQLLTSNAGVVVGPLGTAGIVIVFVFFMLLAREDLRNRIIRLVGYGRLTVTTQAIDDATQRISRYLVAQAIVNGTYGLTIAIGLWIIGKTLGHSNPSFPNFILWGMLCALLRFIPYIGPWIAAAFPIAVSLAVYPGFGVFAATTIMFVVIELLSNNVMEPLLYGSSTGMSAVAVLVAAVFWTWLWGPVGLLLATPLTVCLVVIGKYVPQLRFLDVLLGDEPVLAPHERLYQRWLAMDQEEAADLVHDFFTDRSLEDVYENILLPALSMAEQDRHRGLLDDRRQQAALSSMRQLIEELGDEYRIRFAKTGESTAGKTNGRVMLGKDCSVNVLVLPAHDEADEIVGLMLAQVLEFNGYCVTAASQTTLAGEMMELVQTKSAHVVCVSALPPDAVTHARYLCKRLHQRFKDLKVIVGLWTVKIDASRARKRIPEEGCSSIVTSLGDALNQIEQMTHDVAMGSESRHSASPGVTSKHESSTLAQ